MKFSPLYQTGKADPLEENNIKIFKRRLLRENLFEINDRQYSTQIWLC